MTRALLLVIAAVWMITLMVFLATAPHALSGIPTPVTAVPASAFLPVPTPSGPPQTTTPSPLAVAQPGLAAARMTPRPSPVRTVSVTASVTGTQRGTASTYGPGFGSGWLAVPQGRGVRVRVCGPAACIERTSSDAGPSAAMQRLGRIIDLSVRDFELVSGLPWTAGLVSVTVEVLR